MASLKYTYLLELEDYLKSGSFTEDFFYSSEDRRLEILEFAEKLMDVAELVDEAVTKIIFRNNQEA